MDFMDSDRMLASLIKWPDNLKVIGILRDIKAIIKVELF